MVFQIINETKDFIIINKPAGILVHPINTSLSSLTLTDWLVKQYPEIKKVGDEPKLRPGIVHRLDKDVSGLLVIARTPAMFFCLKKQFQEHRILKEYLALTYGVIKKDEGKISFPLEKGQGRTKVKPREVFNTSIKPALTYFEVIKRFQHYTLVKVRTETGRTNQIRAHFYGYSHSLVGDQKYCHKQYRNRSGFTKFVQSDRVFLHAERLGFWDLQNQWREYDIELPLELKEFVKILR